MNFMFKLFAEELVLDGQNQLMNINRPPGENEVALHFNLLRSFLLHCLMFSDWNGSMETNPLHS